MRLLPLLFLVMSLLVSLVLAGCREGGGDAAGEPTATATAGLGATATPGEAGPTATPTAAVAATIMPCPAGGETGSSVHTTTSGGVERSYRLYVPASYDASRPVPLVLNFHGFGSTAVQQEAYSGIIPIAEANGFVLVTPDGTNNPRRWHIYGPLDPSYVDDAAFAEQLIDAVSASICIDPARIYAMGISNGGGMSALLSCQGGRIAAIATVAGAPFNASRCASDGPTPVIAFHGTADAVVPFEGGTFALPFRSVRESIRSWAEHNGCDPELHSERIAPDVVLERYTDCDEGADVLLYVIEGGGHTWPGSDFRLAGFLGETTQSIEAAELIWSFFEAH